MPESRQPYRKYLQLWLVVVLAFLCLMAVLNYLVDPYGMFDTVRIQGLNASKPAADTHVRLAKPYQVAGYAPHAIIGGNSRPEMGLNPANTCWPDDLRPVFDLALPGANVYMQARMLQHAIADSDTRLVLWGLDFLDFLNRHAGNSHPLQWPPGRTEFEDRLKVNADGSENRGYSKKKLQDFLQTLFSLDTVKDSLKTLSGQANLHSSSIRRDGFNPALDYLDIIMWEGQGVLFQQKNSEISRMFSRSGISLFQGKSRWSPDFESVRRLLQFARNHNVTVVLFINPYHADYLLTLDLAGRWPQFESWKRKLASLADEFSAVLWDFSEINSLSTELAPAPGDKQTTLEWFWEPAHYRMEYGDLMLGRMLQRTCEEGNASPAGSLITTGNIDAHISRLRTDMLHYKEQYVQVVERLRVLRPDDGQITPP
jgi:hypothetical protein